MLFYLLFRILKAVEDEFRLQNVDMLKFRTLRAVSVGSFVPYVGGQSGTYSMYCRYGSVVPCVTRPWKVCCMLEA